jgi:hypothetical protein
MILMMVVLSSVPFGIGTTFCAYSCFITRPTLTLYSLFFDKWRSFRRYMGLDHHVSYHTLYRCLTWRNSISVSCRWWGLLLGVRYEPGGMGTSRLVDSRMAVGCGQCHRNIDRQLWVRILSSSHMSRLTRYRTTQLILASINSTCLGFPAQHVSAS